MLGRILDQVARDVLELDLHGAADVTELAVNLAVGAELGDVLVDLAELDFDGAAVGADHRAVGTVGMVLLGHAGGAALVAELALLVPVDTLLPHVVRQILSHVVLLAAEGTSDRDELTLPSLLPHVQVEVQLLQPPQPKAPDSLHRTVHGEGVDAIAKLPIEQRHDVILLAHGAGLAQVLYSHDALLAEVVTAAAGQVRVLHDREADRTAAVIGRPLVETDVKRSLIRWWNCSHLWHKENDSLTTFYTINKTMSIPN